MNNEALMLIKQSISNWKNRKNYTYEDKQIHSYENPLVKGEYILKFTNSINSFFCNGQKIEISLVSKFFQTTTLSEIGDNPSADKDRLDKFLQIFDDEFYDVVFKRLEDCSETLTTSDPLFF